MPLRPPRKCSTDGEGMVIFGVTLVCSLTNRKCSRNGWLEKPTLPVTLTPRALVSTPANWMPCSASNPSTPSSPSRKSKCHQARRYSPSVTSCMPISSCFLISFSISVSSTLLRSAAEMAPFSRRARASFSGAERRKLPTWSARKGALVRCTFRSLVKGSDHRGGAGAASDQGRARHHVTRALVAQREFEIAHREPRVLAHDRLGARSLAVFDRAHDAAVMVLRHRHHHAGFGKLGLDEDEGVGRGERKIERAPKLARQYRRVG